MNIYFARDRRFARFRAEPVRKRRDFAPFAWLIALLAGLIR